MHHHTYFSTGQYKNTIQNVKKLWFQENNFSDLPLLKFEGTVKLHGTNASIYSNLNENNLVFQSKNNILNEERDNYDFYNDNKNHKDLFLKIFQDIKNMIKDDNKTAVIYGEWCGGSIQPKVALAELPKMFVIFGIKITNINESNAENEIWFSKEQITNLISTYKTELNSKNIFSIYQFPHYELMIDFKNPKNVQNQLIALTKEVENECPVGKFFGISGVGEGIVWKCVDNNPVFKNKNLVFKVKGEEHSVSNVATLAEVDTAKVNSIAEFVGKFVTENRLNQGIEYLKEQHLPITTESTKQFIQWMIKDCVKEEKDVIELSNISEKELFPVIASNSRNWFTSFVNKNKPKI